MKWIAPFLFLLACGKPIPTPRHAVDLVRKNAREIHRGDPRYNDTLQVKWLGTASYIMQLGDTWILTDPFYSYHSMITTGIGSIKSEPIQVAKIAADLQKLPKPAAIFISHSHYDHLLDLAELYTQMQWTDIPIIGSPTTKNILAGYGIGLENNVHLAQSSWHPITENLKYQAIKAGHAPHLKGITLYAGCVDLPCKAPPYKASQFRCGQTYAYLFELSTKESTKTVYFTGAATNAPEGFPDSSIQSVDLAILCVPGWRLVSGYPESFIERLQPPYVLASHYDDFFHKTGRREVIFADLQGFIDQILTVSSYATFKEIMLPAVGTRIDIK